PIACTRRGDVWVIDGAYEMPPVNAAYTLFATGLHEPLGIRPRMENGRLVVYVAQRAELTRLIDLDGDDVADRYETVCDDWGLSGNYHEFTFGPEFDEDGYAWLTLCLGFNGPVGHSAVPWRGWSVRIDTTTGDMTPMTGGLRSPNGVGRWTDGTMFSVDNQGDWVGTCKLMTLRPGGYNGHPESLPWWTPELPEGETPPMEPAAVWFPYGKMGQSTADVLTDTGQGSLGPWKGQIFAGDQTSALVSRVFLEVVDGVHQGACFPFRKGLDCGVNRLAWGKDGSMFVGQTDRGWGSVGDRRYGIQRILRTDLEPLEIKEMRLVDGGFDLEFTADLDEGAATNVESYDMLSYTYLHHATYGSPEVEKAPNRITGVERIDARTVRVLVDEIRTGPMGFVHELRIDGVRARDGRPLLHDRAYYTVQRLR
ncbi:MAG: hypothetical protein KDA28_11505, partial [Phycisphaerales bacterium]|nr:hypothetical protein [Phycisphaerales bacterium]